MNMCSCGSGRPSDACCEPYLAGFDTPPSAEALMRSRFVAYTRADIDYLERTSGGEAAAEFSRKDATSWAKNATFTKLEVLATEAGQPSDTTGLVDFAATYVEQGRTLVLRERSLFVREGREAAAHGFVREGREAAAHGFVREGREAAAHGFARAASPDATPGPWRYVGRQKGDTLKRDAPRVGRNDPCPCGSGLKFKKCHGA